MGYFNHGADLLVNSSDDESALWSNLTGIYEQWAGCFFVCGSSFMTIAEVDTARKKELRKLLLEIKPFKSYGVLVVDYI